MRAVKLRWGILGAAEIARKNWKAIHGSGNSTVVAVASRDPERSRRFVAECQAQAPMEAVPAALGSYEALLASNQVDAVYVPLPTGVRKEWVVRAAQAGKHVVCEKPCAPTVADLRQMLEACRRHGVQFMDGVMFMHSRRLERLREFLDDGQSVGALKRVTAAFSFPAPPEFFTRNIRAHSALEPLGCLGDLGWYCLRLALWAVNGRMPRSVTGRLLAERSRRDSPAPVPAEFSGELRFDGDVSAGFYCSFLTGLEQWAMISGTRGCVRVPDFVLPVAGHALGFDALSAAYQIQGCDFRMNSRTRPIRVAEHSHGHPTAQETNLFRHFAAQVRTGRLNDAWPEIALKTQIVLEACLESARADGRPREPARAGWRGWPVTSPRARATGRGKYRSGL